MRNTMFARMHACLYVSWHVGVARAQRCSTRQRVLRAVHTRACAACPSPRGWLHTCVYSCSPTDEDGASQAEVKTSRSSLRHRTKPQHAKEHTNLSYDLSPSAYLVDTNWYRVPKRFIRVAL